MGIEFDVFRRQRDVISLEELNKQIHIFGLGTIGSWSALSVVKMGCMNITLHDFDVVEEHNIPNQFYSIIDNGNLKTESLKDNLMRFSPTITNIKIQNGRIENSNVLDIDVIPYDIVVSAYDNMDARKSLYEKIKDIPNVWLIDGRMALEEFRIFTINTNDEKQREAYERSLQQTKIVNLPCGARSIGFNGFVIGGVIGSVVKKILKNEPTPYEISMTLKNYQTIIE